MPSIVLVCELQAEPFTNGNDIYRYLSISHSQMLLEFVENELFRLNSLANMHVSSHGPSTLCPKLLPSFFLPTSTVHLAYIR